MGVKTIGDVWNKMVSDSKDAIENFNDFSSDKAIVQAANAIESLQREKSEQAKRIAELVAQLKDSDDMLTTAYMCGAHSKQPAQRVPSGFVLVKLSDLHELKSSISGTCYRGENWELEQITKMLTAAPTLAQSVPEEKSADDSPNLNKAEAEQYAEGWNDCRQAILTAAPKPEAAATPADNCEGWETLAMELAAEEHDDIHHLIYENMNGYPEPWGEVWMRYEREAKRMIELVRKHTEQPPATNAAQDGWMPIETAPKSGRTILLGYFNSHRKWRTLRGRYFTKETIDAEWEEGDCCEEGWYETSVEYDGDYSCWFTKPTHWQPLPAAPQDGRDDAIAKSNL